jgi:phosphinothricin acetyltransferase
MPTIRPAVSADLPQLVETYNHYIEHTVVTFDRDPVTVEDRLAWFESFADSGPHRLLVACDGERVLGCASSSPYRTHTAFAQTVEFGIYLDPGARARGTGSALYRALLDALRVEPVRVAVAGIALPNEASVALHRRFGFAEVGVFEEYAFKGGTYISSLWMQRRL